MQNFINYLQAKNYAKATQKRYLLYVNRFIKWFDKDTINCTKKDILNYLSHLKNHKNQNNDTRKNALIGLNHYFAFLQKNDLIISNPTTLIKLRGTNKKFFTISFLLRN